MDRVSAVGPILEEARALGFLGPEPVDRHIRHARALASAVDPPRSFLDLGSGAGVPGLVLAMAWPEARATLLDAADRRSAFCGHAVATLGLGGRVTVVRARAEDGARRADLREQFDLVVARSFARPPVTAECGAPFVRLGGSLLVSEPPEARSGGERWPAEPLARLGLGPADLRVSEGVSCAAMAKLEPTADRYPRRTGIPAKRPLWPHRAGNGEPGAMFHVKHP